MSEVSPLPSTPPEVARFLLKSKIPRARAVKKLEDVLRRVAAGAPPLDRIREIWAFGSFARGAPLVGDVDLYLLIDEPRDKERFALDAVYERRDPFADHIKALGCSGSSFVSIQAHPVFNEAAEPISPERLRTLQAIESEAQMPVEEPVVHHVVTGEPLAGPFVLLWARGDELDWALERLHAIQEQSDAGRHERTTTVPLLDDLTPKLGLVTAFELAAQVRKGNIACQALLLDPADAPPAARTMLEDRYFNPHRARPSVRAIAAAAALHHLADHGVDLREVQLVDRPVTENPRQPRVFVDFNPFQLYLAAAGSYDTGHRLLHVWATGPKGPWLALELTILDHERVLELHHWLTGFDATPAERGTRMIRALADPAGAPA